MKKVSAVILNYNTSQDCRKCIDFLQKQDYREFDIIVVDNASTDKDDIEELKRICHEKNVDLILNEYNKGFSAGNNAGLKKACQQGTDYCLVINPDVELRDVHYISHIMREIDNYKDTVVAGSKVILPEGELQNPQRESNFWEEFLWPIQSLKSKFNKDFNWYYVKQNTGYCEKLSGCCFFIEKEFIEQENFLDENVFMYSEEAILAKMVSKANKKMLYVDEATAFHQHYKAKKESTNIRMKRFLSSRRYFIKNYSEYNTLAKQMLLLSNYMKEFYETIKRKK